MVDVKVASISDISRSFPSFDEPTVPRYNYIMAVEELFEESNCDAVIVEGGEGVGKTTILAQFVQLHPQDCIAIFAAGGTRFAYDPVLIQADISNQIEWLIEGRELQDITADSAFARNQIVKLQRHARHSEKVIYFVVDGLGEIPDKDHHMRDSILELLPIGQPRFRIVLSGDPERVGLDVTRARCKTIRVLQFTIDETFRLFESVISNQQDLDLIWRVTRGVPARLAAFRRLMRRGQSLDTILAGEPSSTEDILELEWYGVEQLPKAQRLAIAVLALESAPRSVDMLAQIVGLQRADIEVMPTSLSLLKSGDNELSFHTEALRRYASQKLSGLRTEATELLVDYLLSDPDSDAAITSVPLYLDQLGRVAQLLEYLTSARVERILQRTQTATAIRKQTAIGFQVAARVGDKPRMVAFAVENAAAIELNYAGATRLEIEALLATGNIESARRVVDAMLLKEDRLQLLAVIYRRVKRDGGPEAEELLAQIKALAREVNDQIGLDNLGEKAIDIAGDLLYADTETAIRWVEELSNHLLASHPMEWKASTPNSRMLLETTREKASDDVKPVESRLRDVMRRMRMMFGEYTAQEILDDIKDINAAAEQIVALKYWLLNNAAEPDATIVLEHALDLIESAHGEGQNATDLRMLATPLPYINDEAKLAIICARLARYHVNLSDIGPSADYVRFTLLVAIGEARSRHGKGAARLVDLYLFITEIQDMPTRAEALAWFLSALHEIDSGGDIEQREGVGALATEEFELALATLLRGTASQCTTVIGVIRAIATTKFDRARALSRQLNTEHARNHALMEATERAILAAEAVDLSLLANAIADFTLSEFRDDTLLYLLRIIDLEPSEFLLQLQQVEYLADMTPHIEDVWCRCEALCVAARILMRMTDGRSSVIERVMAALLSTWSNMGSGWQQAEAGFRIVGELGGVARADALTYLQFTERIRQSMALDESERAEAVIACLRLLIRCLGALIACGHGAEAETGRVLTLITEIPDLATQIDLLDDLAARFAAVDQINVARRIVDERITPMLNSLRRCDAAVYGEAVLNCAASLYATHAASALDTIAHIPLSYREDAYRNAVRFMTRKVPVGEPSSAPRNEWPLTIHDVMGILDLANLMATDHLLYDIITDVTSSITAKRFDNTAVADIAARIDSIANSKFPAPSGVPHAGYAIATKAHVLRLTKAKAQDWLELIRDAKAIPNIADAALVLSIIVDCMPAKQTFDSHRNAVVEFAITLCEQIPAADDRIGRFVALAEVVAKFDRARAVTLFKRAAATLDRDADTALRLEVVDAAYRTDPNIAKTLSKTFEDGHASGTAMRRVRDRVRQLGNRDQFFASPADAEKLTDREYASTAWRILAEMTGDQYQVSFRSDADQWLERAGKMRLAHAYPVLCLYIENESRRLRRSPTAKSDLHAIFESVEEATVFTCNLVRRTTSRQRLLRGTGVVRDADSVVVRVGERQAAIEYLRGWISEQVMEYVKISDPYFDPDQLWIARLVGNLKPDVDVTILTSNHQAYGEEAYRKAWRESPFASRKAPQLIIAGDRISGASPIHDRWIVTVGSGLRLGTSLNALGEWRVTEISPMSADDARAVERSFDEVTTRRVLQIAGRGIDYRAFSL